MSILKIKENNEWKDIITLKGDKGDPGETGVFIGKKEDALETHKLVIEETENHKSVSGTEINITDGIDSSVKRLKQYGYTKQEGTPTPDAPVEIEVGEAKNLLSVPFTQYNANNLRAEIPNFKAGTYTFSFKGSLAATWQVTARKIVNGTQTQIKSAYNVYSLTFTLEEDATLQLEVYRTGILLSDISEEQLEKGEKATSYLPPNTIESKSNSSNLFNAKAINNTTIEVNEDGSIITMPVNSSGNGNTSTATKLKELAPNLKVGDVAFLNANVKNSNYSKFIFLYEISLVWNYNTSKVITQEMLDSMVFLYGNNVNGGETEQVIISDLRMIKGTEDKPFESYKESSIQYNLGDNFLADKDYIENGVLNKNIGKVVLNGSESGWAKGSDAAQTENTTLFYFHNGSMLPKPKGLDNLICDKFPIRYIVDPQYSIDDIGLCGNNAIESIMYIRIDQQLTLEEFKAWLGENPLTIYYELATPEQIQLETTGELRTFEPNTIITNDLDTNMEVDYNTTPNVSMYYRNKNGNFNKMYM